MDYEHDGGCRPVMLQQEQELKRGGQDYYTATLQKTLGATDGKGGRIWGGGAGTTGEIRT